MRCGACNRYVMPRHSTFLFRSAHKTQPTYANCVNGKAHTTCHDRGGVASPRERTDLRTAPSSHKSNSVNAAGKAAAHVPSAAATAHCPITAPHAAVAHTVTDASVVRAVSHKIARQLSW